MEGMKMKKIYALCFAALCAVAMISCSKDVQETLPADENPAPTTQTLLNPVTLTFEASPETKVTIDGTTASWEEGDRIKIISLDADGNPKTVVSEEVTIQNGGGRFTATVETSDIYYAVWPETLDVTLTKAEEDGGEPVFTVDFSTASEAKSVPGDAAYYAAKTTAESRTLDFKAISTILEVKTEADDATGILFGAYVDGLASCSGTFPVSFDTEGNVSLGEPASAQTNVTFGINGAGTYYLPLPGTGRILSDETAGDGFILCLTKGSGNYTASYYENAIQLKPGKIYGFKDRIEDRIVGDYYVSPDGTGAGLAEDAPVAFDDLKNLAAFRSNTTASAMMRNGVTVHLAGGTYTAPLWCYKNSDALAVRSLTLSGSTDAENPTVFTTSAYSLFEDAGLTTKIENVNFSGCTAIALRVTYGSVALENCKFVSNVTTSGNGSALAVFTNASVSAKACEFTANKATDGAGLTVYASPTAQSDDHIVFTAEDCLFSKNEASGNYGGAAVLIAAKATGGQVRFNNCRFEDNKVTAVNSHGAVLFSNNSEGSSTMAFFNACSFSGNTKTTDATTTGRVGYEIYGNTGTRIALNNCTLKSSNCKKSKVGCDITCVGQTVISNTTIWGSGCTGGRALAWIGGAKDSPATVVNCMIHHKNTDETLLYNTLFLTGNYYLNMSYSIYAGLDDSSTKPVAVEGKHYNFTDCYDRGLKYNEAPDGATYLTNQHTAACTIRGIKHEIYKYNFAEGDDPTYLGFSLASKDDIIAAVDSNKGIGAAFSAWLKELGAYDVDILGKPRVKMYPGAYHNTQD